MALGKTQISVRDATAADAAGVAALSAELAAVLRGAGNPVAAALSEAVICRDGFGPTAAFTCLVAEAASAGIVGYALLHPAYDPDLGGRTFALVDLYVLRSARRGGVGTRLMRAALERADACGARALSWWIRERNPQGIAFYESLGARVGRGILAMHLPLAPDGGAPGPAGAPG